MKQPVGTTEAGEWHGPWRTHKILFDRYYPETGTRITGKFELDEVTSSPHEHDLAQDLVYDGKSIEDYVKALSYYYDDNIGKDYIDITPENEKDLPYIFSFDLVDIDLTISLWGTAGNYLTMIREGSWYTGGAHGYRDDAYYIIDIQQEKLLGIEDVMQQSPEVEEQMAYILETALQEKYGRDFDIYHSNGALYFPEYFKFDYDGITFMWPQYTIAASLGPIDVTLPYSKVEKYLTTKGVDMLDSEQKQRANLLQQ
jgi:hypothetical protein